MGFPGRASGNEFACQCRRHKRCGFDSWVRKIPWRAWPPTPVFLLGESHGQRSLAGYSPWDHKELDMTEHAGKDRRQEEKGMTKDEMVGWHYQLNRHEFEQALGVGDAQGRSPSCCSPWGRKESDMTEQLN